MAERGPTRVRMFEGDSYEVIASMVDDAYRAGHTIVEVVCEDATFPTTVVMGGGFEHPEYGFVRHAEILDPGLREMVGVENVVYTAKHVPNTPFAAPYSEALVVTINDGEID